MSVSQFWNVPDTRFALPLQKCKIVCTESLFVAILWISRQLETASHWKN